MTDPTDFLVDRLTLALLLTQRSIHLDILTLPSYKYLRECLRRDADYSEKMKLVEMLLAHYFSEPEKKVNGRTPMEQWLEYEGAGP